jgi:glucan phosphoethanolaminetransferase (alkaline phosphatase superfamily)
VRTHFIHWRNFTAFTNLGSKSYIRACAALWICLLLGAHMRYRCNIIYCLLYTVIAVISAVIIILWIVFYLQLLQSFLEYSLNIVKETLNNYQSYIIIDNNYH